MAFSFTEGEKRFILAEAIKTSNLDVGHLVNFLKPYNIEPNWLKMQLPTGRTMEQCITATEQMFQRPVRTPDLKRKAMGDIYEQPLKRLAAASPVEPPTQLPSLASATQSPTAHPNPMSVHSIVPSSTHSPAIQLVNIQPRPTNARLEGESVLHRRPSPVQFQPSPNLPQPRKRGRPSRADKARQTMPLLPQHLAPLAPAPAPVPAPAPSLAPAPAPAPPPRSRTTESPSTPGCFSVFRLSPGASDKEIPSRQRGRPPSDKTQPETARRDTAQTQTLSERSSPGEPSRDRPNETPVAPRHDDSPRGHLPGAQKERAIQHIGHLTQEGLAR